MKDDSALTKKQRVFYIMFIISMLAVFIQFSLVVNKPESFIYYVDKWVDTRVEADFDRNGVITLLERKRFKNIVIYHFAKKYNYAHTKDYNCFRESFRSMCTPVSTLVLKFNKFVKDEFIFNEDML